MLFAAAGFKLRVARPAKTNQELLTAPPCMGYYYYPLGNA